MANRDKEIPVAFHFQLSEGDNNCFFNFEDDFIEDNIRCIPMIVRFKLDAAGIKLKLNEWNKMEAGERQSLAEFAWNTRENVLQFRNYIQKIVLTRTGKDASDLSSTADSTWANINEVPLMLFQKTKEFNRTVSIQQWKKLSILQRFVLIKLCKPGHENRNFPKALKEFGLA